MIAPHRGIESLKVAARWPGADRATVITLATRLVSVHAEAEGYAYFQERADAHPDQALLLALAGFFQARLGTDIDAALAKLDKAAGADLGPPQFFRGIALAALPADRGRAEQAVADLEFILAVRDQFPLQLIRAVYRGLAAAYTALGQDDRAAEALRNAGLDSLPSGSGMLFGTYWANAEDGFRFTTPSIWRPEPDVHVVQGYDFGDFAFITTSDGVVAIDAGTSAARVTAALGEIGLPAGQAITHLILTHGHFDHIGGVDAVRGPGTQVLAQAAFPGELEQQRRNALPFRYFTGNGGAGPSGIPDGDIVPDRLISEPTALTVGGTEFVLYPTRGGETGDALMIYLPGSGLLFTGDVMMPYLGAPFFAEGSPDGLLETLAFIRELQPRVLIQGHTVLTEMFTIEALPGLEAALTQLRDEVLDGIRHGLSLADILDRGHLPEVLRDHPKAVLPYLVTRDNFTAQLYHQRAGYWGADRRGLEPVTAQQRAAALDLLAGGREDAFTAAAQTLISQGDDVLALQIIEPGLLRHPASTELAGLRRTVMHRLMERYQQDDAFRFLIYAELAEAEIGPVR
jgi:glyoxylase-like metal-dependent hydrolase (beta-lactamase superfamily II)